MQETIKQLMAQYYLKYNSYFCKVNGLIYYLTYSDIMQTVLMENGLLVTCYQVR